MRVPAISMIPLAVQALVTAAPASAGTATAAIAVDTEIAASCAFDNVSAIEFGTQTVPTASVVVPGAISLQCAAGTTWLVRIDQGQNFSGGLHMRRIGHAETLAYEMCADAACNTSLGPSSGPDGVGTGNPQNLTIAARLLPGQSPPPGNYEDLLTVRIDY